jgi:threonylcarbamoyladenosine tRNA methylthiotransferase MtaB
VSRADADALVAGVGGDVALAAEGERADCVVVNTCSVTADAERAARRAIRRAGREHPGARIVVSGCWAELAPRDAASLPGVAAVVGARSQAALPAAVRRACGACADPGGPPAAAPARHTRPFVKVQDGCDRRCAYCVVPAARGPSRSVPLEQAAAHVRALAARHAEVVLTGVHLGHYGRDLRPRRSLADLLRAVLAGGDVRRLRLSSVDAAELPRELLRAPEAAALCPHLHLPLQSGAPRVLAAMRRAERPEDFRAAVEDVAAAWPGACLGTDLIAGFPGETDADHRATVALVEALPLAYLHVFPFSPRPGTAAAVLPARVPGAVVRERAQELLAISDRRWRAFLAGLDRREVEAVVERVEGGVARGIAREWAQVRWPASGEARGEVARVRVTGHDGAACAGVRAAARAGAGGAGLCPAPALADPAGTP